jgi:hypothetical protein
LSHKQPKNRPFLVRGFVGIIRHPFNNAPEERMTTRRQRIQAFAATALTASALSAVAQPAR